MRNMQALKALLFCTFCFLTVGNLAFGQDREVRERLGLDRRGRVSIENHKGSIEVMTWNRDEIDIVARIEPGGSSRREREWVDETEIYIDAARNSVRIKTDYGFNSSGFFWGGGGSSPLVHYTVTLPETAELEIEDHKSEIRVKGLSGELRLNTHKGNVEIENQYGPVDLETHKGEVFVEFVDLPENSRFETHKGDIEIAIREDQRFDLDVDIGDKAHLRSDFDVVRRDRWSRSRWDDDDEDQRFTVAVNGGGPRLSLQSHKGHFRLRRW